MPKVGGMAVLRRIRQDEHPRRMPVAVLSTTDSPHEINTCTSQYCSCYIVKAAGYEAFAAGLQQIKPFLERR
jgi:DNA-binding NarL/FixJ family response regulator